MSSSLIDYTYKGIQKISNKIAPALRKYWSSILIFLLLSLFIFLRFFTFGDLRLSIGVVDTPTYLEAAEEKVISNDVFTRQRLFTTTILYKITLPVEGYELLVINSPAFIDQNPYRQVQPGFENTVLVQILISVISWATLALVFVNRLRHPIIKVISFATILLFALVPQISDWDSILASESLSISLFALSFALLIEFVFRFMNNGGRSNAENRVLLLSVFILVAFLFAFTRDSNLYVIFVTLIMLIPFLVIRFPFSIKRTPIYVIVIFLVAIFLLGYISSQQSGRWKIPLEHVFTDRILPYPLRLEFMQSQGMPDPASAQYDNWFNEKAPRTYMKFLIKYPGYSFLSLMENMEYFFSENLQPYFIETKNTIRQYYLLIGDFVHPTTSAVFIINIFLLGFLWVLYFLRKTPNRLSWAWLGSWLFVSASVTLFLSYHSDSIGVVRHVLGSVIYYRLFLWLFLFVIFDQFLILQLALKPLIETLEEES